MKADGRDAVPVTVYAVDASGRIVPNANVPVEFEVSGPGRNIGVGNGDPNCTLSEKANSRPLFNGYAQLIVQAERSTKKGTIEITAKSEGLKSASCSIKTTVSTTAIPVVEGFTNREIAVSGWRVSLPSTEKPLLLSGNSGGELNNLSPVNLGNVLVLKPKTWIAYYTSAKLPASIKEKGGSLCFKNMTGKGQIYVNGEMLFEKKATAAEDIVVPLKSGLEKIELNILMQPDPKGHLLLGDMVFVTQEKLKKSSSK